MDEILTSPIFQYTSLALTAVVIIFFYRYINEADKRKAAAQERTEKRFDSLLLQVTELTKSAVAANTKVTEVMGSLADQVIEHRAETKTSHEKILEKIAQHDAATKAGHDKIVFNQKEFKSFTEKVLKKIESP